MSPPSSPTPRRAWRPRARAVPARRARPRREPGGYASRSYAVSSISSSNASSASSPSSTTRARRPAPTRAASSVTARPRASSTTTCVPSSSSPVVYVASLAARRRTRASASRTALRLMIAKSAGRLAGRPYAAAKFCSSRVSRSRSLTCASAARRSRSLRSERTGAPTEAKRAGNVAVHSSHATLPVSRHHRSRHETCTARTLPSHKHGAHISPPPSAAEPRQMRHSRNSRSAGGASILDRSFDAWFGSSTVGSSAKGTAFTAKAAGPSTEASPGRDDGNEPAAAGAGSARSVISERPSASAVVASASSSAGGRAFDTPRVARLAQSAESSGGPPPP